MTEIEWKINWITEQPPEVEKEHHVGIINNSLSLLVEELDDGRWFWEALDMSGSTDTFKQAQLDSITAFRQQVKELYDKFVKCPTCHGKGWILVKQDWELGACSDCGETGEQPPQAAEK